MKFVSAFALILFICVIFIPSAIGGGNDPRCTPNPCPTGFSCFVAIGGTEGTCEEDGAGTTGGCGGGAACPNDGNWTCNTAIGVCEWIGGGTTGAGTTGGCGGGAACPTGWFCDNGACTMGSGTTGAGTTGAGTTGVGNTVSFTVRNPINAGSFSAVVLAFARLLVQIGIPLATIFIVFAGFKFVSARGDPKAIEEAKNMLLWTLVGAAVIIGAYAIATAVVNFAKQL